jgi:hypothetical protein
MSDVLPLDRMRVNIADEAERNYWAKCFGCKEEELVAAVKAAGNDHVYAVRQEVALMTSSRVRALNG